MFRTPIKTGAEVLDEGISNLMQRLLAQKNAAVEESYRNAQLGMERQQLPLKMALLQNQALEAKEKAEQLAYQRREASGENQPGSPNSTVPMSKDELQNYFNNKAKETGGVASPVPGTNQPTNSQDQQQQYDTQNFQIDNLKIKPGDVNPEGFRKYRQSLAKSKYMGYGPEAHTIKTLDTGDVVAITPDGIIPLTKDLSKKDEAIQKVESDVYGDWQKQIDIASQVLPIVDKISTIQSNPVFIGMKQNPILMGHDISWYQSQGNPDQQFVIGRLSGYQGSLYSVVGQTFKGNFRVGIQNLITDLKPNKKDSVFLMTGKTAALQELYESESDRKSLASKIYKNNPNISTSEADQMAAKILKSSDREDKAQKMFDDVKREDDKIKANLEKTKNVISTRNKLLRSGEVGVISPDGKETLYGSVENLDKFLAAHKGWRKL